MLMVSFALAYTAQKLHLGVPRQGPSLHESPLQKRNSLNPNYGLLVLAGVVRLNWMLSLFTPMVYHHISTATLFVTSTGRYRLVSGNRPHVERLSGSLV
jgi:hypothetical protein